MDEPRIVVAAFDDAETARKAVDALGRAGIEGGRIHTTGRPVIREARTTDTTRRDAAALGRAVRPAMKASAIGAAIVGSLGFIASITLGGNEIIPGLSKALVVTGATICGLLIGGTIGALVAGIGSMDVAEDWELLVSGRPGPVQIEIVASEGAARQKALRILRDTGGRSIQIQPLRRRAG